MMIELNLPGWEGKAPAELLSNHSQARQEPRSPDPNIGKSLVSPLAKKDVCVELKSRASRHIRRILSKNL